MDGTQLLTAGGLLDVAQAAAELGIQPATVYRYFHRGLLRKTQIGRSVFVSSEEIQRFSAQRKSIGNPNFRKVK